MIKRVAQERSGRQEFWVPPAAEETSPQEGEDRILWGRQVEGASIAELNMATRGLGKKMPRVLDVFIMGLVHAHRLNSMRKDSPLEDPSATEDLLEALADMPDQAPSLDESVVADVLDVRSSRKEVAVYLDYPWLLEEQYILARALSERLGLAYEAAPGPKVSRRAFGRERRYPITNGYRE